MTINVDPDWWQTLFDEVYLVTDARTVGDSDTAGVDVIAPSIEIDKTPDLQTILSGDDATFTITVTNTGDAPLRERASSRLNYRHTARTLETGSG